MTMVATLNHLSKHHPCGRADHLMNGGAPLLNQYYYYYYLGSNYPHLISLDPPPPPPMAEDNSTTNNLNDQAPSNNRDDGWLQLSIGGDGGGVSGVKHEMIPERTSGLVELDLLPGGGRDIPTNYSRSVSDFSSPEATTTSKTGTGTETGIGLPLFFGTSSSSNFVQQEINWAFRPVAGVGVGTGFPSSSSPSTSVMSSSYSIPVSGRRSSYFGRPLIQFQSVGDDTATVAGPSSDVRIINPPRRPHSGIWFTLKALENQGKQPFLPQISKNYLRIKDEKMTVGLVMKYLVNKLHLDSESEIEIRCRGQELLPFWTLQHVRDRIWNTSSSSNSIFTLLPHSSTTNHLMFLHYGRKD